MNKLSVGSCQPLGEKHYEISPYVYCANNPIILIDPDGMDWVKRVVDGRTEVYYDRDVKSQDDIYNKYGKDSEISHIKDGSSITINDENGNYVRKYTFYNDHEDNKYGVVKDGMGNTIDNSKINYEKDYTIFGTSDKSLNAETLHKNYMGTSYTGDNNPRDYEGGYSYQYDPKNISEYASRIHDQDYDAKSAKGPNDAFLNTDVLSADINFVMRNNAIASNPSVPIVDRLRAKAAATAFKGVILIKASILLMKSAQIKSK